MILAKGYGMRGALVLAAVLALATLGGCDAAKSDAPAASATTEVSSGTLAAAIATAPGMTSVAAALKGTGLAGVFDGSAPYTLLAPDDDAFGALGETGRALQAPENGAAMARVLRAHVLPGYVTVDDIEAALAKTRGKPVKMTTMAGGEVSFAREGETLKVTASDGASAKIAGQAVAASNGVAIPIDAFLRKTSPTR